MTNDLEQAAAAYEICDYATAFRLRMVLAEQGNADAQCCVGYAYYQGEGTERNPKQAVYWYEKAALQGDVIAQYNLACAYEHGDGVDRDPGRAFG